MGTPLLNRTRGRSVVFNTKECGTFSLVFLSDFSTETYRNPAATFVLKSHVSAQPGHLLCLSRGVVLRLLCFIWVRRRLLRLWRCAVRNGPVHLGKSRLAPPLLLQQLLRPCCIPHPIQQLRSLWHGPSLRQEEVRREC